MRFDRILDRNPLAGQPQAGLWFGKTDDLWQFGKPTGSGGVWRDTLVAAGRPSDPFLILGFDHKTLHLRHNEAKPVRFSVEVDFLGDSSWAQYAELTVPPKGYYPLVFPDGFGAEWARLVSQDDCTATAWFTFD